MLNVFLHAMKAGWVVKAGCQCDRENVAISARQARMIWFEHCARVWRLLAVVAAVIAVTAAVAPSAHAARYRLHYAGIVCRAAPCADWDVTDQTSGERFSAVVVLPGRVAEDVAAGRVDYIGSGTRGEIVSGQRRASQVIITQVASTVSATTP